LLLRYIQTSVHQLSARMLLLRLRLLLLLRRQRWWWWLLLLLLLLWLRLLPELHLLPHLRRSNPNQCGLRTD